MSSLLTNQEKLQLLEPFAVQIYSDINSFSTDVIDAFYNDYEPSIYIRKFGLYDMWRIKVHSRLGGFDIVTTYSSAFFTAKHANDEGVFWGPFMSGYHGGLAGWETLEMIPKMSPSPAELIDKYIENYSL